MSSVAIIPCSDDFRHPDGTIVKMRRLPDIFFPAECLESWGGPVVAPDGADGSALPGWTRVRSPPPALPYPRSSAFRCHQCLLRFSGPPMFIPVSVQTRPGTKQLLVSVEGHYCCQACRVRALEAMPETCRLHMVRVDLACLGRTADMAEAAPRPVDLEPFGGPVPLQELLALRARTGFAPEDLEMLAASVPSRVCFGHRPRFVRETYYGTLEGGCGEEAALQKLLLASMPGGGGERAGGIACGEPAAHPAAWRRAGADWGLRFVDVSPPPAARWMCQWCTLSRAAGPPVRVPEARDPTGTVSLRGAFCSTGCAMSHLLHESRHGVSPSAYAERLGIMAWLAVHRHGVPFGARLACAPHRLELVEFGGDLPRSEFDAQKTLPDLHTCLEVPPFCSARMAPNYTRPGVICDLSRVGAGPEAGGTSGGDGNQRFELGTFTGRFHKTHGLFDALIKESGAETQEPAS